MTCKRFELSLIESLDNLDVLLEQAEFKLHSAKCQKCKSYLSDLLLLDQNLLKSYVQPPPDTLLTNFKLNLQGEINLLEVNRTIQSSASKKFKTRLKSPVNRFHTLYISIGFLLLVGMIYLFSPHQKSLADKFLQRFEVESFAGKRLAMLDSVDVYIKDKELQEILYVNILEKDLSLNVKLAAADELFKEIQNRAVQNLFIDFLKKPIEEEVQIYIADNLFQLNDYRVSQKLQSLLYERNLQLRLHKFLMDKFSYHNI